MEVNQGVPDPDDFGTVTSVSVVTANGFQGTVANPTTTPAITLSTSLTAGSVPFIGAGGALLQDNANLFWDDTNNRLGIGTSTPSTSLHILDNNSGIRVGRTSNYLSLYENGSGTSIVAATQSSLYLQAVNTGQPIILATQGSERMRIAAAGNVGIGTTSPSSFKLQVAGDIGPDADSVYNLGSATNRFGNVFTRALSAVANTLQITGGSILFTTGSTDRVRISEGLRVGSGYVGTAAPTNGAIIEGSVGIGTSSPSTKLDVTAGTGDGLRVNYTAGVGSITVPFQVVNDSGLAVMSIGSNKTATEGTLNLRAPTGQGAGSGINFFSDVGGTTKTGFFQMDSAGNMVFRQSNGSMFYDYISQVNFRNSSFVNVFRVGGSTATVGRASSPGSATFTVHDATASTGQTQLLVQGGAVAGDAGANQLFRINQGGGTTEAFSVNGYGTTKSQVLTVATLPSAATVGVGSRSFVSDALTPVFGSAVTGGGAVPVPVYSDGTNWNVG